jgi:hypothetical protein
VKLGQTRAQDGFHSLKQRRLWLRKGYSSKTVPWPGSRCRGYPRLAGGTMPPVRLLTQPAVLILLAANAVPIAGVLFWRWDAFLLLVLYWISAAPAPLRR